MTALFDACVGPGVERAAAEFWVVVRHDRLGQTDRPGEAIEDTSVLPGPEDPILLVADQRGQVTTTHRLGEKTRRQSAEPA
jgi:hypothetical protein